MKNVSARPVATTKERDAVTTKYEELCSSVLDRVGLVNTKIARLEAEIANVTQKRDASVAKEEQLLLKAQCVSKLAEEAEKLRERLSAFETAARPKILKGSKSLAPRSKRKRADVEAEMEQARIKSKA